MKCRSALLLVCLAALLAGAASPLFSLSIDEIDANASLVFIGSNPNPQPPLSSDPNFGVTPMIGVSVPFRLGGPFFFEPGLEFLGLFYDWNSSSSSAEITQSENGFGFFTIGALLSLQGGVSFPVAKALTLGGAIGLDAFLRFPGGAAEHDELGPIR